ncbi:MAG: ABC transporter ATP-binding protein [Pseudobdellovibrionaceae bacterium]
MTKDKTPLLAIKDLAIDFKTPAGVFHAVQHVSFDIYRGETMALVGESGSGKSITALSIMQLLPSPLASHPSGSIVFDGQELMGMAEKKLRAIRGDKISMIFQEPLTALNPLHTVEKQIGEMLKLHKGLSGNALMARIHELMDLVGLSNLKNRLNAYPHELSGGQRQRVMIAMALANEPDLLIADEPTTALDVTIQAQILELLNELKTKLDMALLLITHDLNVVEKMVDKVAVMQNGVIVEQQTSKDLFAKPSHDYTKMLLAAQPKGIAVAANTNAKTLLEAKNICVHFPVKKGFFGGVKQVVKAVDDVSVSVREGQTLGIVGESGSGKTTLGLALLKLLSSQGTIVFNGTDISDYDRAAMRPLRGDMQIVFQDPFGSLSPRMSIAQIVGEGLAIHAPHLSKDECEARVIQALKEVHLDPASRNRYPHEFSGGQRQRISIARALVLKPKFIVMDEPTSALDMSVQAEVVDLLRELQTKHNLTYMFISHDLRVVRALSHDIVVMRNGKVVESGTVEQVFDKPKEEYTRDLMFAALELKSSRIKKSA